MRPLPLCHAAPTLVGSEMKRRELILAAAAAQAARASGGLLAAVPVHRISDAHARCGKEHFDRFWAEIWPEAVRDLGRGGIRLETTDEKGEVKRSPGGLPLFKGLRRGVINLVLTAYVPEHWDRGRASAGVSTLHQGFCICLIALRYAHPHRVHYLAANTCVHELMHALLGDVFVNQPPWHRQAFSEARADAYATRLHLAGAGPDLRAAATGLLGKLRPA